jgi:hypothetical protein
MAGGQTALHVDGTIDGVDSAVELNQKPVALAANEPTLMQRDRWFEHGFDAIGKSNVCALLVYIHQTAIANDVCEKDRRQPPFEMEAFHSGHPLPYSL